MHQSGCTHNIAPIGLSNALVTQAHTQNRNTGTVLAHQIH